MKSIILGLFIAMQFTPLAQAQAQTAFKPVLSENIDDSAAFNGKDRPYIFLEFQEFLDSDLEQKTRLDATSAVARDLYQIVESGSGDKMEAAEVKLRAGGIMLFGNYNIGKKYTVAILREIPCYDVVTGARVGQIAAGRVGDVTWSLQADNGLDRKKIAEFSPAHLTNTKATGKSASLSFDFKLGITEYLGRNGDRYVDFATNGNVSPQKDLSLNKIEGHLNYGLRLHHGVARVQLTNKFQSTQDGDQIDYVLGGEGVFLPPLAISWFSRRFAWDPTIKFGYGWARQVAAGPDDNQKSANRLTYGLHWVVPILDIYALSLDGSGLLELKHPVTSRRFHDDTTVSFLVLIHEKEQTKVQTVFKFVRGEAAPSFQFNQSVVLGLLMQLR